MFSPRVAGVCATLTSTARLTPVQGLFVVPVSIHRPAVEPGKLALSHLALRNDSASTVAAFKVGGRRGAEPGRAASAV